jgi:phosphoglycerate dehydrogenase-like enzyme
MRFLLACLAMLSMVATARAELDPARVLAELELRESDKPVREMKGWVKPKKILVLVDGPNRLEWLKAAAPGVELIGVDRPGDGGLNAIGADALVGVCNRPAVTAALNLKWVHIPSAGVNECLAIPKLAQGDVLITNMQRVYGPPIAEHVIAMTFYLARNFGQYTDMQRAGNWDQQAIAQDKHMELQGRTMLVIGLGGIGTSIAQRAHALGMKVIATRNSSRDGPDYVTCVGLANETLELATRADVVVNTAPLTPETKGMFNAAFFARMKPSAYFINIGRGSQVNQADLAAALEQKVIAGAGLDVADPEPLPKDHPLWKAPNIFITPHVSSYSAERLERFWIVMRENLRRYVAGDKVYSVVDVKRGY